MTSLFELASQIEMDPDGYSASCKGKILATLFFESSTRTRLSFESAMLRLGGTVLGFSEPSMSSHKKGESFHDTLQMVNAYADVAIVRHYLEGISEIVRDHATIPVISGGTGTQEHPTQALLDLYTMYKEFGSIDGLRIGVMGDLRYGRTVPSLLYGLRLFSDVEAHLVSPSILRVRNEVLEDIEDNLTVHQTDTLNEALPDLDVLYVTRIQKERFHDPADYQRVKTGYVIDASTLGSCKPGFILMHPLPRVGEIAYDVDELPCARYFPQARNGVWMRMALILQLMGFEGRRWW